MKTNKINKELILTKAEKERIIASFKTDNPEIISCKQAKLNGLTHYFTGKKCLHGHLSIYTVCDRSCCACRKLPKVVENKFTHIDQSEYILNRMNLLFKTKKPNAIKDMGSYIIVYATNKNKTYEILVDRYDYYTKLRFYRFIVRNNGYCYCCGKDNVSLGIHQIILLSTTIDHKNGNKLDNRKTNLQKTTTFLNNLNNKTINSTTGYKGVYADKNKFIARINHSYTRYHLGMFTKPILAAMVYDNAAYELLGEYAQLNRDNNAAKYWEDFATLSQEEITSAYTQMKTPWLKN